MAPLIKCCVFLLLALEGGFCVEAFRDDYERSDQAGGWLKYHAEPATWEEARLRCQAEGAVLASPLNNKLNSAIIKFVNNQKASESGQGVTIFTGVHAIFSKGDYASVEGVPLKRLAITWAPGEPDNYKNSESCLAMTFDYFDVMADTRCDRKLPYVCYNKDTVKQYRYDYEWSELAGGWLNYHEIPSTWDEAKSRCEAEGAVLASPLNKELETSIVTFVHNQETYNEQGVTIFIGDKKTYKKAIEGVPNNLESCPELNIGFIGTKAETRCDKVLPYVCYKKNTSLTMSACGTTDPEYVLEPRTGSCYKFHSEGLSWSKAYMTCMAEGGYLAVINNNMEATVVKDIFAKHPWHTISSHYAEMLNVGFHDWGHFGTNFNTVHGETLQGNYHTWAWHQPDNKTRIESGDFGEPCGAVDRNGKLHDNLCNVQSAFLCEKLPNSLSN